MTEGNPARIRVGRNDLCPCKSGKKFKRCHLNQPELLVSPYRERAEPQVVARFAGTPEQLRLRRFPDLSQIRMRFARETEEQRRWTEQYGHVRPIQRADFKDRHFVGVGTRIYWGTFDTVFDFLDGYVGSQLGKDWQEAEKRRSPEEQHQITIWRRYWTGDRKEALGREPGKNVVTVAATGASSSYFLLAWDLFSIDAFGQLQKDLISRLKIRRQFQGVRHELFALATLVRAGYAIEHHPRSAKAQRRAEFNAVHQRTGRRVTVEAKSRHRHGVLGFTEGTPKDFAEMGVEATGLLAEALNTPASEPLVLFLDLNLPPFGPERRQEVAREVADCMAQAQLRVPDEAWKRFVAAYVTNFPLHYQPREPVQSATRYQLDMFPHDGGMKIVPPPESHLLAIAEAVQKFGQLPDRFAEAGSR